MPRWSTFYWSELTADVVIALITSLLIGFVVTAIWKKDKTPQD
jgi:uncharacterized membrane protein YraQ (UPF0718 family)